MEGSSERAMKVSRLTIAWNAALSAVKLLAGVFAHSGAMISDAVHSLSDVFSTVIVMFGIRAAQKASDKEHPYGHERMECVAAIVLSGVLLATGLMIGWQGVKNILSAQEGALQAPGILALLAAVLSIAVKEGMYRYTRKAAKELDSSALMADAWHHRSDALSSIGALIGIGGARLGVPVLDPVASLVICLMIVKAAYDIFKDAIDRMVDSSCDDETEGKMRCRVEEIDGVISIDLLHTRIFGNKIYVDIEIGVDETLNLAEAHGIAETVHDAVEESFPQVKHVMVHVNPKKDIPETNEQLDEYEETVL